MSTGWGSDGRGYKVGGKGGGTVHCSHESLPEEWQDLIWALLQLRPHVRLDLQQVATHS